MTHIFDAVDHADRATARLLLPALATDQPVTRRVLNDAMLQGYGGSDADGRWTQRTSFEVLEHALALHFRAAPIALRAPGDVVPLTVMMERLPTHTVRSEDQIAWQQFSTPVDIAALAVLLANIDADDIVLEPSAGNGLLVAHCPPCRGLQLNEIDPSRLHGCARTKRVSTSICAAPATGSRRATVAPAAATKWSTWKGPITDMTPVAPGPALFTLFASLELADGSLTSVTPPRMHSNRPTPNAISSP